MGTMSKDAWRQEHASIIAGRQIGDHLLVKSTKVTADWPHRAAAVAGKHAAVCPGLGCLHILLPGV